MKSSEVRIAGDQPTIILCSTNARFLEGFNKVSTNAKISLVDNRKSLLLSISGLVLDEKL